MSKKRDYYEVLGVDKNADDRQIKTAYRKLANIHHPDKSQSKDSEAKMREINEAYEVLSDPEKRSKYDQYGHDGLNGNNFGGFGFGDFGDIFESFFSQGGSSFQERSDHGDDYSVVIEISFIDSILGTTITKNLKKQEGCLSCHQSGGDPNETPRKCTICNGAGTIKQQVKSIFGTQIRQSQCSTCSGEGKVYTNKCKVCHGKKYVENTKQVNIKIPAGVQSGSRLRVVGFGSWGLEQNGDLIVSVIVKPHPFYERQGFDLFLNFPVAVNSIFNEENVNVPTPHGNVVIKLKNSYTTDTKITLKGKGVSSTKQAGNLYITLKIIIPQYDKSTQKELKKIFAKAKENTNNDFIKQVNSIK